MFSKKFGPDEDPVKWRDSFVSARGRRYHCPRRLLYVLREIQRFYDRDVRYCGLWIVRTRWMWHNVSTRSEAKTNRQAEIEKDEKLVSHCSGRTEREAPFLSPVPFSVGNDDEGW